MFDLPTKTGQLRLERCVPEIWNPVLPGLLQQVLSGCARPCTFTAMLTANLTPTDYIATEQLLDNTPLINNLR
jgi:hypothetical protein